MILTRRHVDSWRVVRYVLEVAGALKNKQNCLGGVGCWDWKEVCSDMLVRWLMSHPLWYLYRHIIHRKEPIEPRERSPGSGIRILEHQAPARRVTTGAYSEISSSQTPARAKAELSIWARETVDLNGRLFAVDGVTRRVCAPKRR